MEKLMTSVFGPVVFLCVYTSVSKDIQKVVKNKELWVTWVAQSVKCLPLAQVMMSGSWDQAPCRARAPGSGSALGRESACLSPSPSAPPPACAPTVSHS